MTDPQPRQPSSIEHGGIRTERYRPEGTDFDCLAIRVTRSGAQAIIDIAQAHDLLDQLAWQLGRPDLISAHRFQPQRRVQPGAGK